MRTHSRPLADNLRQECLPFKTGNSPRVSGRINLFTGGIDNYGEYTGACRDATKGMRKAYVSTSILDFTIGLPWPIGGTSALTQIVFISLALGYATESYRSWAPGPPESGWSPLAISDRHLADVFDLGDYR